MRVALRVDASSAMGTGHLRRCLSLAQALQEQGAEVVMLVRPLDTVAAHVLQQTAVSVTWLPAVAAGPQTPPTDDLPPHPTWAQVTWQQDAGDTYAALRSAPPDWVVVDHYAFDARWHDAVRAGLGCRLLVVDDIADRPLAADVLLDHNASPDHREKYRGRLTAEPVWLVGPRFALLSAAYLHAPRYAFHPEVRSIGIFMGGTDPGGVSAQVLDCVRADVGFAGAVEVVSTSSNPHLAALRTARAAWPQTRLTLDEPDLAAFFARHDLQIGAGGGATWERCCIGVPTIALVVAANQVPGLAALRRLGALRPAQLPRASLVHEDAKIPTLADVVRELLVDATARRDLCQFAATLVDGRGAQRVALGLTRPTMVLRPAAVADAPMLHAWRNHPAVRAVSTQSAEIAFKDHLAWVERTTRANDRWLLVAQVGRVAVGSIRFDRIAEGQFEVSIYLDPELQGLGLGRQVLLQGEQIMSALTCADLVIHADVTPGNQSSCRLFESCAYDGGPTRYTKTVLSQVHESEPTS